MNFQYINNRYCINYKLYIYITLIVLCIKTAIAGDTITPATIYLINI